MSSPIVQIVEVIGPAAQGKSMPLLCGGADGHRYYVKGQQTNRASLWREWICGHRAAALQVLERCATPDFWRTV